MKKSILTLAIAWMMIGSFAANSNADEAAMHPLNMLTQQEEQDGFVLLFDGKTTDGWRNYKKDKVSDGWKIRDGALTRVGQAGDIVTDKKYDAFELILEFKISPEGNSGLMYHVTETNDTPWMSGPEVQIQDNVGGHDPQKCGWLYQLYTTPTDSTKPAGQWNELRLVITPEKCEHYVNGMKYVEYVKGSEDWVKKVAASKFSAYKGFGEATDGYIALQDHGDEVAFRNIRLRDLSK